MSIREYLEKKYSGYHEVGLCCLEFELLPTATELAHMKREISKLLGRKKCPKVLPKSFFCDYISNRLASTFE